jgi:hypothetical protein
MLHHRHSARPLAPLGKSSRRAYPPAIVRLWERSSNMTGMIKQNPLPVLARAIAPPGRCPVGMPYADLAAHLCNGGGEAVRLAFKLGGQAATRT